MVNLLSTSEIDDNVIFVFKSLFQCTFMLEGVGFKEIFLCIFYFGILVQILVLVLLFLLRLHFCQLVTRSLSKCVGPIDHYLNV